MFIENNSSCERTEMPVLQESRTTDSTEMFMQAYREYKQKVYEYAYLMTQCSKHAEDVMQDVFVKLWLERDKLAEIDHLKAYLYRITRNRIIDQIRRSQKEQIILGELAWRKERSSNVTEELVEDMQYRRIVDEAVNLLPKQRMLVYSLGKMHGWKRQEISSALGISEATVRVHMNQALKFVRKYVSGKTGIRQLDNLKI